MSIRFFPNRLGRDPGSGLVEVPISRVGPYDTLVIVVDHLRSSVYVRPSTAPWSLVATWQSRSSWLMDRWIAVCFSVDPPFPSNKLPLGDRITRYQQSDTNDDLKNHPLNSLCRAEYAGEGDLVVYLPVPHSLPIKHRSACCLSCRAGNS
jgi:hypothetical protein